MSSPIITKRDTFYRFSPDGKYRESILQCDTAEEFERALMSLKTTSSLPESVDISNIMSLVRAKDKKNEEWDLKLDKRMQKEKSLNPQIVAAIIGAGAAIIAALIAILL